MSERVFGSGSAEFEAGPVKVAETGPDVVDVIEEPCKFGSEPDADPLSAQSEDGGKAGTEVVVLAEPKSAAEQGFVLFG